MAYGKIKADAFIYDDNGNDTEITAATIASNSNKAPLASPTFTGTPAAPTAAEGTNTTQIATTAFVNAEIAADTATKAPLASPAFTGTPTAPTAAASTNTTQLATTAFVTGAIADLSDSAPSTLDTLNELAAALGDDANFSTTVTNSIAAKLPLAGGTLTGDLVLAGDPDANLKAATKQYVDNNTVGASGGSFTGDVTFNEAISIERVKEKLLIDTTAANGTINFDAKNQAILYSTSNATGNYAWNIRGDSSTTLNSLMSIGQTLTVVGIVTYGSTAYYTTSVQVDGSSPTRRWVGGAPSSAGTANSICATTITLIKTADATFTALISQAEYEA